MEWTDSTTGVRHGVSRKIEGTAEDGHVVTADLVPPSSAVGVPRIFVTANPLTFDDASPDLERFPTFQELVEAADILSPGSMFATMFPTLAPGTRQAPPPGPRAIPLEWMGHFKAPGSIEVVGSIGDIGRIGG